MRWLPQRAYSENNKYNMERRILDLGCGTRKVQGATGVDMNPAVSPDVVFELQRGKELPFSKDYFDEAHMIDFLEHVDDASWALSEVHRVTRKDSLVHVRYPHFSSNNNFGDLTHRRRMDTRVLEHFDPSTEFGKVYRYYGNFGRDFRYRILNLKLEFPASRLKWVSQALLNEFGTRRYEFYFSRCFPIENVNVRLMVLK